MNRRSVSFIEPPHLLKRSHFQQPTSSAEETDVDLPRQMPVGQPKARTVGVSPDLSIDCHVPTFSASSVFLPQISPVIDPSTYDQLALCDCAMFPECILGKGVPLDLDEERRQKKRATDFLDVPLPLGGGEQRRRRPKMTSSGHSQRRMSGTSRKHHCAATPSPPPSPPPLPPHHSSSPSRSPSPSSSSASSSASSSSHSNFDGKEKAILFRLPLTITKAKRGRKLMECEVREQRLDGGRAQAEQVDFTEMGLFVAPSSETDPEEAFVVVERRNLFPSCVENLGTDRQSTSIGAFSPSAASHHHSPHPHRKHSPATATATSNHHASAENLLSVRVTEPTQRKIGKDLDRDQEEEEEEGGEEEEQGEMDMPPIGRTKRGIGAATTHLEAGQSQLSGLAQQSSPSMMSGKERREELGGIVDPQIRHIWAEAVDLSEIRNIEDQTEFRSLRAQLGIDKISAETLSQYHVKGHMDSFDQPAICYPRYRGPSTRNRIPNGLKLIRRVGDKLAKENFPPETDKIRFSGIFGLHMITQFDNRVVLCTNERDALAVYDASNGIPALSLPQGERFDPTVIPYLEDFDLIYIWFPHIHERFAKDYASYLNAVRCYIITAPLRPVELVRDNRSKEVLHSIQDAVRVRYKGFRSVQDLRDSVRSEIVQSKSKLTGLTLWKRYSLLNNYLRGFRPSELTVLSGGSHGKTTFMCEYAMDLYTQGIRTLFCNFEMPEEKILKWMIIQFAGPSHVRSLARSRTFTSRSKVPLQQRQDHSSVEMWLDRFERTHSDLVIMKTEEFREKTLKEISDAIREQSLACGTQHLVIDNLQALVDMATVHIDPMTAAERTHQQDRFVGMLRRMASSQELHITLVVHPVKEPNEHGYYELHHIGGPSAKITQESDNVLVIQRRRDTEDRKKFRKFLYILKNRFGGRCLEADQIEMLFQPSTLIHTLVEVAR